MSLARRGGISRTRGCAAAKAEFVDSSSAEAQHQCIRDVRGLGKQNFRRALHGKMRILRSPMSESRLETGTQVSIQAVLHGIDQEVQPCMLKARPFQTGIAQ